MTHKIEQDLSRFKQIVKGKIREDLKKHLGNDELIGRQGKDLVSIPIPHIETPKFSLGPHEGVGSGEGDKGVVIGREGDFGEGPAGTQPGRHIFEAEVAIDEITQMLLDQIELPNLQPTKTGEITSTSLRMRGIQQVISPKLATQKSYKEGLKHGLTPEETLLRIKEKGIARYRSFKDMPQPQAQAALIEIMDVSGSMSDERKNLARLVFSWMERMVKKVYPKVETRHIIHDTEAHEVNEETFYHTRESGGTQISSAYALCSKIIKEEYSENDWNTYVVHASDGDNMSFRDDQKASHIVTDEILPKARLFAFNLINPYPQSDFVDALADAVKNHKAQTDNTTNRFVTTTTKNRDDVLPSILAIFGKKK